MLVLFAKKNFSFFFFIINITGLCSDQRGLYTCCACCNPTQKTKNINPHDNCFFFGYWFLLIFCVFFSIVQ